MRDRIPGGPRCGRAPLGGPGAEKFSRLSTPIRTWRARARTHEASAEGGYPKINCRLRWDLQVDLPS